MAYLPDHQEIPGAIKKRNTFYWIGAAFLALAVLFIIAENGSAFLLSGGIGAGSIWIGTKIKTHRKLIAKTGLYR